MKIMEYFSQDAMVFGQYKDGTTVLIGTELSRLRAGMWAMKLNEKLWATTS